MENILEQIQGQKKKKERQSSWNIDTVEPHYPWSNTSKGEIYKLKRGSSREMYKFKPHKTLWNDCFLL